MGTGTVDPEMQDLEKKIRDQVNTEMSKGLIPKYGAGDSHSSKPRPSITASHEEVREYKANRLTQVVLSVVEPRMTELYSDLQASEQIRDRLHDTMAKVWKWIEDKNNGLGVDVDDLIQVMGDPPEGEG